MKGSPESNPTNILANNEIRSWSDLSKLIEHFSKYNGHDWLFRGTTSSFHSLLPKVGRPRKPKPLPEEPLRRMQYTQNDEQAVFDMFKGAARAYVTNYPVDDLEWLALAQHYGAPTRLLDWTSGLLVAMWFALEKSGFRETFIESKKTFELKPHDAALWVIRGLSSASNNDRKNPFAVTETKFYRPPHISPRIGAQQSVFTLSPNPTKNLQHMELVKFTIKSSACFQLRKRIDACGINQSSLFPDTQGLGEHLAWRYKNNWLSGYR